MTAIEYLILKLFELGYIDSDPKIDSVIRRAKELEKEQMEKMWTGGKWSVKFGGNFERFYNRTYESNT